jgi:hypothetical protein
MLEMTIGPTSHAACGGHHALGMVKQCLGERRAHNEASRLLSVDAGDARRRARLCARAPKTRVAEDLALGEVCQQ